MKRPTLTAGQRIASRFANGWYGWPAEREEKLAQAIDRAIKAARKDARLDLRHVNDANNPYRRPRK